MICRKRVAIVELCFFDDVMRPSRFLTLLRGNERRKLWGHLRRKNSMMCSSSVKIIGETMRGQ